MFCSLMYLLISIWMVLALDKCQGSQQEWVVVLIKSSFIIIIVGDTITIFFIQQFIIFAEWKSNMINCWQKKSISMCRHINTFLMCHLPYDWFQGLFYQYLKFSDIQSKLFIFYCTCVHYIHKHFGRLVGFYGISTLGGYIMPTPLCTYILNMIWFSWVLWHINPCRLYYANSSLYVYIKYDLV